MTVFVYLRVSTNEQDVNTQFQSIKNWLEQNKIEKYYIIKEEGVSGGIPALARPKFKELYENLKEGDVLVVSELSRLGRSLSDVIFTLEKLTKEKKVRVVSVKENLDSARDELQFKVMTTMISLFADLEREFIRKRTKEGLERAKKEGKHIGRPYKIIGDPEKEKQLIEYLQRGYKIKDIAKLLDCSERTVRRAIRALEEQGRIKIVREVKILK